MSRAAGGGRGRARRPASAASLAKDSTRTAVRAMRTMRDLDTMGRAAATTIALRSQMIAEAFRDPAKLADPELTLMVSEKMQAAAAVTAAVVPQLALPALHAMRWLGDHAALMARQAMTPLSLGGGWHQYQRLAEGMAYINAAYGAAMLGTMVELGAVALRPVHRAATANARRLGQI
jgi:hypothetical protein